MIFKQPLRAALLAALMVVAVAMPNLACAQSGGSVSAEVLAAVALRGDAERGQSAFKRCAMCHRKDGSGRADGSIPRLSGQHASVIVKQVMDIHHGRRLNPAMKAVLEDTAPSPQTVADLAAYLQQLPVSGAIGKALYEKDCAVCHGGRGEGDAAQFVPMVAQQHHGYLRAELDQILGGERGNSHPDMVKVLQGYAKADLQAVADYMAQLPPIKR